MTLSQQAYNFVPPENIAPKRFDINIFHLVFRNERGSFIDRKPGSIGKEGFLAGGIEGVFSNREVCTK